MQMLATYLNQMQKIQEEYGEKLQKICLSEELLSRVCYFL